MNCNKCKHPETKEEPLAICDKCSAKLCQACAKISSTEYRAVTMKSSRALLYWCLNCRADAIADNNQNIKQLISETIREEIALAINNLHSSNNDPLNKKLDSLSNDIRNLRDSNVELVRFLTQDNPNLATPPLHNTSEQKALYEDLLSTLSNKFEAKFKQINMEIASLKNLIKRSPSTSSVPLPHNNDTNNKTSSTSSTNTKDIDDAITNSNSRHRKPRRAVNGERNLPSSQTNSDNRHNFTPIVGTRKVETTKLVAAKLYPKTLIQVRKLNEHVTEDDLKDYLECTFGKTEKFKIEKLTVKSGDYVSFKVEARADLLDKLLDPSNWPEEVEVKQFFRYEEKRNPKHNSRSGFNHRSHRYTGRYF